MTARHGTTQSFHNARRKQLRWIGLFVVVAVIAFVLSLTSGSVDMSWQDYIAMFSPHEDNTNAMIIFDLRLPYAIVAFITGALLAVAGALMQVLLRNPLADPYILGISGGASVFALIAMLLGLPLLMINGMAFVGALLAVLLVFGLAHGRGSWNPTRLLLTGIVIAAGWGAIISFILSIAPSQQLRGMLFWLMGDLGYAQNYGFSVIVLIIGLTYAMMLAPSLNIIALGSNQAQSLGVNVSRVNKQIYVLASILTASAVVMAGSIGFVGLVIPHLLRLMGIRDYRLLLPCSVLFGGSLLVLADAMSRSLFDYVSLPVGVMTVAIGVPIFIYLLYRGEQRL